MNNKLAIEQVPPGVMHVVLLGQGNDLYDFREENLPADKKDALEKFEKHFGHRRANYFNKTWEGNQLQEIIKEKNAIQHCLQEICGKETHGRVHQRK